VPDSPAIRRDRADVTRQETAGNRYFLLLSAWGAGEPMIMKILHRIRCEIFVIMMWPAQR
jgi:hypothetical protein